MIIKVGMFSSGAYLIMITWTDAQCVCDNFFQIKYRYVDKQLCFSRAAGLRE